MNALALSQALDRRGYLFACAILFAGKIAVTAALVTAATGRAVEPLAALNPWLTGQDAAFSVAARLLLFTAVDLPFLWVGILLSCRRAADAGLQPLVGVLFALPLLNYLVCVLLCALPSRGEEILPTVDHRATKPLLTSAATGASAALAMMLIAVMLWRSYGSALFVGAPFILGIVTGFVFNRGSRRSRWATVGATQLALLLVGTALVAFALEGVVCVVMAYPLAAPVAALGGALGAHLAAAPTASAAHLAGMLMVWPVLCGAETWQRTTPLREVLTVVEIDAPPPAVWTQVTGFAELPPPQEWVFRLGIAYPRRARTEGAGPGAVRYCEFSTGPFVEPITAWEEPSRLAFDVASTPPSMHEWSPYQTVHAPHLVDGLRSQRGEFRLVPLGEGRTRLEGRTWYRIEMFPQAYWSLWSDALIHSIHGRVLNEIKHRAETSASAGVTAG